MGTLVEVKDAVEAHVSRVSGHSKASSAIGVALHAQLHLDLAVDTLDDGLKSVGFHQRLDGSLHIRFGVIVTPLQNGLLDIV